MYFGVLYLIYRDFSRFQSFYFVLFALIGMVGSRIVIRLGQMFIFERDEAGIGVLIVGKGQRRPPARQDSRQPAPEPEAGRLRAAADSRAGRHRELTARSSAICGDVLALVPRHNIGEVVIVPRWYSPEVSDEISRMMYDLQRYPVSIRLAPDFRRSASSTTVTEDFGGLPLIGVRTPIFRRANSCSSARSTSPSPSRSWYWVRRCSRWWRWSPRRRGSILLRQERVTAYGNRFMMYKFRSMYANHNQLELTRPS
ncbi:MAG: hypothetical protein U0521_16305 [Anaerolineae bacterium]